MVDYPVSFNAKVEAEESSKTWRLNTEENLETEMSTPEEFGGDSENPSPEDLFNASLASCMVATFKVTAQRKGLDYSNIEGKCETQLDRNEEGRPVMKRSKINIKVEGVFNKDLADEVAKISEKNCFIHNSVETDVKTSFEFTE